jgi:hypothetical protein
MKNELDDLSITYGNGVDHAWRNLSSGEVGG